MNSAEMRCSVHPSCMSPYKHAHPDTWHCHTTFTAPCHPWQWLRGSELSGTEEMVEAAPIRKCHLNNYYTIKVGREYKPWARKRPLCVPDPCWDKWWWPPQPSSDNVNNDAHSSGRCASVPQFVLSGDLLQSPLYCMCPWREYRGLGCSVCNSRRTVASETFGRWI